MDKNVIVFVLVIPILLITFIVLKEKFITKKEREFFVGKGNYSWFVLGISISVSFVGGASTISMSSLGYKYGFWALVDPLSVILGCILALLFMKYYSKFDDYSLGAISARRFIPLKILLGLVSLFVYVLFTAAQIAGLNKLFYSVVGSQLFSELLTVLVSITIFLYVFLKGFEGVVRSDILQFLLLFGGLTLPLLFFLLERDGFSSVINYGFDEIDKHLLFLLTLSVFFVPVSYTVFTRVKASKSLKHARLGVLAGGFFYFVILFLVIFSGMLIRSKGLQIKDSECAIFTFFSVLSGYFMIVGYLVVSMAIYSSIDTFVFNSFISAFNDVVKPLMRESKDMKLWRNLTAVFVSSLSLFVAFYQPYVLNLILFAMFIYIAIFFPIIISRMFFPVTEKFQFASAGLIILILLVYYGTRTVVTYDVYMFPVMHIILLVILKFVGKKFSEEEKEFF